MLKDCPKLFIMNLGGRRLRALVTGKAGFGTLPPYCILFYPKKTHAYEISIGCLCNSNSFGMEFPFYKHKIENACQ